MNWDNLLTPLLFFLFIGVPLLNRLNRSQRGGPKPDPQEHTGSPRPGATNPLENNSDTQKTEDTKELEPELSYRLEAARRRVAEATAQMTAPPSPQKQFSSPTTSLPKAPSAALTPVSPTTNKLGGPPKVSPSDDQALVVTHVDDLNFRNTLQPEILTSRTSTTTAVSERKSSRQSFLVSGSKRQIIQGIIWKQILDDPLFKTPRRAPFQRR